MIRPVIFRQPRRYLAPLTLAALVTLGAADVLESYGAEKYYPPHLLQEFAPQNPVSPPPSVRAPASRSRWRPRTSRRPQSTLLYSLLKEQRFYEALQEIDRRIANEPKNLHLVTLKGQILRYREDYAASKEAFHTVLKDTEDKQLLARAWQGLGLTLLEESKLATSVGATHNAASLLVQTEEAFQQSLALQPNQVETLVGMAQLALQQKDIDKAKTYLAKAEALSPNHYTVLTTKANVLKYQEAYDQAASVVQKALRQEGDDPDLYHLLASIYWEQHDKANAMVALNRSLKLMPNHVDSLKLMSKIYADDDAPALARESLNKAIAFDPTQLSSVSHLIGLYNSQDDTEKSKVLILSLITWFSGLCMLLIIILLIRRFRLNRHVIRQSQQQFETIFDASPDGMILLNHKLQFQLANTAAQSWLPSHIHPMETHTFFEVFECQCPNLKKCQELSFLLCTSDEYNEQLPDVLETVIHSGSEKTRTLRMSASRINVVGPGKEPDGFICCLGDISSRKALERDKEAYIATLTHDLKTPLVAQNLIYDNLVSGVFGPMTDEQKQIIDGAKQSTNDLLEMVNSTLLFYQIESSKLNLSLQGVFIPRMIEQTIEELKPLAQQRGLTFTLNTPKKVPHIQGDPIQLKRVFHNLINNAIHYCRKNSTIDTVIRVANDDQLVMTVTNAGKGISAEDLTKIFQKYFSASQKFKRIGSGLGLYISRRIVELHGGQIVAESIPEKTTTFTVTLPLTKAM